MRKITMTASVAALLVGTAAFAHGMMGMGDGDITRAEAQQKAAAMFARMDANGDGLLNDADRTARLEQRFQAMDADHNGSISHDEFMAGHADRHHGDGPMGHDMKMGYDMKMGGDMKMDGHGMGPMGRMGHGHRGMLMKMADKNGDGSVSAAEFSEAHLAMFDKADTNHDGTLTAAERHAAMESMMGQMGHHGPDAPQGAPKSK